MANMSYCRFQNTFSDLKDCVRALENGDTLSEDEMWYAERMRHLCESFIEALDGYEPDEEE